MDSLKSVALGCDMEENQNMEKLWRLYTSQGMEINTTVLSPYSHRSKNDPIIIWLAACPGESGCREGHQLAGDKRRYFGDFCIRENLEILCLLRLLEGDVCMVTPVP